MTIDELVNRAYENSRAHGFHEGETVPPDGNTCAVKLALIHSEVSEALEDAREGKFEADYRDDGKPLGYFSELADIIIRTADHAGQFPGGVERLEKALLEKMAFNEGRPHKHGKGF